LDVKDFFSFVGGAAVGAAIGAGIIFFSSPKSGSETRQTISDRWNGALELGRRAAREREQELWADFNTRVKAPAGLPLTNPAAPEQTLA
jgi:gas vesicle protein